jgi:hypothetical protein
VKPERLDHDGQKVARSIFEMGSGDRRLEVAGSTASYEDIIAMETLWKQKLQSREMGLNRN